ncbi:hypothetical protein CEXT_659901 [Caerostris extrusa]|uniref:Uncharacterized protein n=1 Tax=Caerostris extrusa TaxID=172846 RepID=A0AAV4MCG8_CAEEX|nr:hypothetical protein CEXT_659901 [Caerostris extrusa]
MLSLLMLHDALFLEVVSNVLSSFRYLLDRKHLPKALHRSNDGSLKIEYNSLNVEIRCKYIAAKREAWRNMCSKLDPITPNSKLWKLAKSFNCDQCQVEECNIIQDANGSISPNNKTSTNILGEF